MSQTGTNELNQLLDRYIAVWNEPDAELRRKLIAELWTEDGVQFTGSKEHRGHQALMERITAAYEQFVKTEGFLFKPANDANTHHNAVKLSWEMVPAAGGEAAATGIIFLLLSNDGRIQFDYQF